MTDNRETAIIAAVRCPECGAAIGLPCQGVRRCHSGRRAAWQLWKRDQGTGPESVDPAVDACRAILRPLTPEVRSAVLKQLLADTPPAAIEAPATPVGLTFSGMEFLLFVQKPGK